MAADALSRDAFLPRADGRFGVGAALALLAHAGLIAALALGLNWRLPRQTAAVSAELWAAVPQTAAPAPAPEVVRPAPPAPPTQPAPRVSPAPPAPPPPTAAERAAEREAEIATEKAAQRKKELLARQAQDAAEHERQRKEQEQAQRQREKALEDQRLADEKALALKRDKLAKEEKAREDKRKQELTDQRAEQRERQQKEADAKAQDARVAKQREENLKRMMGQAGASGATSTSGGTGHASASAGPSAGYAGRVSARIKSNIIKATEVSGNPVTEVEVRCAPDGNIIGRRIVKSSGNPAWDEIVLRAIDRTAILPRDTDGRIPNPMLLSFSRQE